MKDILIKIKTHCNKEKKSGYKNPQMYKLVLRGTHNFCPLEYLSVGIFGMYFFFSTVVVCLLKFASKCLCIGNTFDVVIRNVCI